MADIGSLLTVVNSKAMNVFVGSESNEFVQLQNARLELIHDEVAEDVTSGDMVWFSGGNRYRLSGTSLYSTGMSQGGTFDAEASILHDANTGEVPEGTWIVKLTAKDSSTDKFTLTAKLEQFIPTMSVPGGTKVDLQFVIVSLDTVT
jgi:hypothetical protein